MRSWSVCRATPYICQAQAYIKSRQEAAISNAVLPALAGFRYPSSRQPIWSGKVQTAVSGKETRLSYWSYPRWQWTIGYDFLKTYQGFSDFQQLVGFYNARQGQFDDWLYSDPDDNTATAQQFGVGDGVTTQFYLSRTLGGFVEPVNVPVVPFVLATSTGPSPFALGAGGAPSTGDPSGGLITFTTPPAAGVVLSWTGTFMWRVRFDDIQLTLTKMMQGLWSSGDITFTSTK